MLYDRHNANPAVELEFKSMGLAIGDLQRKVAQLQTHTPRAPGSPGATTAGADDFEVESHLTLLAVGQGLPIANGEAFGAAIIAVPV